MIIRLVNAHNANETCCIERDVAVKHFLLLCDMLEEWEDDGSDDEVTIPLFSVVSWSALVEIVREVSSLAVPYTATRTFTEWVATANVANYLHAPDILTKACRAIAVMVELLQVSPTRTPIKKRTLAGYDPFPALAHDLLPAVFAHIHNINCLVPPEKLCSRKKRWEEDTLDLALSTYVETITSMPHTRILHCLRKFPRLRRLEVDTSQRVPRREWSLWFAAWNRLGGGARPKQTFELRELTISGAKIAFRRYGRRLSSVFYSLPHLTVLRALDAGFDQEDLRRLAKYCPQLSTLHLQDSLHESFRFEAMNSLERLAVVRCGLTALTRLPFPNLTHLNVGFNRIGLRGLCNMLATLPKLCRLIAPNCAIKEASNADDVSSGEVFEDDKKGASYKELKLLHLTNRLRYSDSTPLWHNNISGRVFTLLTTLCPNAHIVVEEDT